MALARRRTRIALLGCGGIARQYHLRALTRMRDVHVVALADPDREARELAAARAPGATQFDTAGEAIAQDLDAVVICAPNAVHAELAIAAAEAGRHVYVEKPLATDPATAAEVVAATDAAGIVAAVGFSYRYDPTFRRARDLLQGGAAGTIETITAQFREPGVTQFPGWKATRAGGGGALLDLAVHYVDLLAWMTGDEIDRVTSADIGSRVGEHDEASFEGVTSGGARLRGEFGYGGVPRGAWVFDGDAGRLVVERRSGRAEVVARGADEPAPSARERLRARSRTLPVVGRERSFGRALAAWIGAVNGTRDEDLATPADGLRAQRAIDLVETAASTAKAA